MRRISSLAAPLAPLLVWSLLWWVLGKPMLVLAGVIFAGALIGILIVRAKLESPELGGLRNLITAGGLVLGLCCAVLAATWNSEARTGDPLAVGFDPLSYDGFEVVGRIVAWNVLPVSNPMDFEEWDPVLVLVGDDQGSFEFICDGRELRTHLEEGRTIRASGALEGRDSIDTTPVASWVEFVD